MPMSAPVCILLGDCRVHSFGVAKSNEYLIDFGFDIEF